MGRNRRSLSQAAIWALALSSLCLSGCGSLHYLFQAGQGQLSFINHARPIGEVVKDEKTPPRIRKLLQEIPRIKEFGKERGLKPTTNYIEYVKLDRKAAVWVVSACEPLQFKSKTWGFPIVGTFPYLGWFDLTNAKKFVEELKKEGWDVDLRGASAYSTLGWFRDAILSSMIPEGHEALGDLVNVVIHESVHVTTYIKGEAYFNESVASFVADRMTPDYLDRFLGPKSVEKQAYVDKEAENEAVQKRLHESYDQLSHLYASKKSDSVKEEERKKILEGLKEELGFKREINNATLVQYKTYNSGNAAFEKLFQECRSSWPRFIAVMKKLEATPLSKSYQSEFDDLLQPWIKNHCQI